MRLPPSYLINTLAFVRLVLKEVEISVMLVLDPVCAGYSHHCPREFAVLAVLVEEARRVKRNAYLLIILFVIIATSSETAATSSSDRPLKSKERMFVMPRR